MVFQLFSAKQRLISKIDIMAPKPLPERHGVAIVVIAKNEAQYIGDWLAFHSLAGIREVFLYDHGSNDATTQIARSFSDLDVTIIPWHLDIKTREGRGGGVIFQREGIFHRQVLAYCHAICSFGSKFRWMAFIDIDEFIIPRTHGTIPEALKSLESTENISLPWVMFGHSGHTEMPDTAVPFAYRKRAHDSVFDAPKFKCIVDPCAITQASVHMFMTKNMGNKTSNMLGQITPYKRRTQKEFATNDILQLNHYYLKSLAETEHKIYSSDVSDMNAERREANIRRNAKLIESNTIEDDAAVAFLSRHGIFSSTELRSRYPS